MVRYRSCPDLTPRLSGLNSRPLQHHLIGVAPRFWIRPDQAVYSLSMHEIGPNESGKGERAMDSLLRGLSHSQQQEPDPRNPLQQVVENAIVVPHGVASHFVSRRRANV